MGEGTGPNESPATSTPRWRLTLTTELVLGAVPLLGAADAFLFNFGRANAFGISSEFVSVSVAAVGQSVFWLIFFVSLAAGCGRVVQNFRNSNRPQARWANALLFTATAAILILTIFSWKWLLSIGAAGVVLALLLWRVIMRADKKLEDAERLFGKGAVLGALCVVLAMDVNFIAGQALASGQRTFGVVHIGSEPELVELALDGDNLVCAPLDRVKREFGPDFVIVNLTAVPQVTISPELLGPLRRAKAKLPKM